MKRDLNAAQGIIAGSLMGLALIISVAALADSTVGKAMTLYFQMFRQNCNRALFTVKTKLDHAVIAQSYILRNNSTATGDYCLTTTPGAAGEYEGYVSYSGIPVVTVPETVRLADDDINYTNIIGAAVAFTATLPKFAGISSGVQRNAVSIAARPTNPLLASGYTAPDNAGIAAARKTMNNISGVAQGNKAAIAALGSPAQASVVNNRFSNNSSADARGFALLPSASQITSAVWGTGTRSLTTFGTLISDMWSWATRTITGGTIDRTVNITNAPENGDLTDSMKTSVQSAVSSFATNAFANATSLDKRLTAMHGTGLWNAAGNVTVLPFQGAASYDTVVQGKNIHITRGDSVSIPYSIGKNLTGWTVWFGAKATPGDVTYAITPRDITAYLTNTATGSGLINLSTADTDLPLRKYSAEMEIRKGSDISTALKFNVLIDADVIK